MARSHGTDWSYEGLRGPEQWGGLSPDFDACSNGAQQSPVELSIFQIEPGLPLIQPEGGSRRAIVADLGHTLQASLVDGGRLLHGGVEYRMVQFHYHRPSEHIVGGASAELELHFVHQAEDGRLAVIGVLLDEAGEDHAGVEALLRGAPSAGDAPVEVTIDPSVFLPAPASYHSYPGSLTTPPCTEGVEWIVLRERGGVSRAQLDALDRFLHPNARPAQPLGARAILSRPDTGDP